MEAQDLMSDTVYVVSTKDSVAHARKVFIRHKISTVLVMDNKSPIGILDEQSLTNAFLKTRQPVDSINVQKIMKKTIVKVKPNSTPEQVAKTLITKKSHSAIVYDKEVMGIITRTDLIKYFSKHYPGMVKVSNLMRKGLKTVKRQHSISHAIKTMEQSNIEQLIVMDPKMVGIISQKDIAFSTFGLRPKKLVKARRQSFFVPFTVEDLMRPDVETIPPKSDAASAAKAMLQKGIGSLVVVSNSTPQGIITKTDITRYLASRAK